ncbi:MAG: (2E,6E)-farnesyl diphosphate synthase [Gammaproteobacteria bacterium]|nr:(2E,6E)-farnesyl diphosphate synthase [Gammaproteobacteria bacterium]MCG3145567.1 Farnesyl diphosphate synthase [Gammaproteobacteria bacterium]
MSFDATVRSLQARSETALDRWLPPTTLPPTMLHEAMRYSVLGGGKRVRPLLVYLAGEAVGAELEALDAPAVAVELIHAYSLVHDDLPAMDNDDLRRGRPTCHRVFGEAMAILAGDALQAHALHVITQATAGGLTPAQRLAMVDTLAGASGSLGMAGGQALDLAAVGRHLTLAELENMHLHKTGALIRASVRLGALASASVTEVTLARLDEYARCIGLAFQVQDDILDIEGATETIGKPQGSDAARNKPTYPNLLGLEGARAVAERLYKDAIGAIAILGAQGDTLRAMADYIVRRDR